MLHKLLRKNSKWNWGREKKRSFAKTKEILCSTNLLVHYNPEKPLVVACDVSPYGLGAVLPHTLPDGSEKPIAYSSTTLLSSEELLSKREGKISDNICDIYLTNIDLTNM